VETAAHIPYPPFNLDLWMPKIAKQYFDTLHGVSLFAMCDGTYAEKSAKSLADQSEFKNAYWSMLPGERRGVLSDMGSLIGAAYRSEDE